MSFKDITHGWKAPESLGYSSMRPVRLAKCGIAMAAAAVTLAIGGLVLGTVLMKQSTREEKEARLLSAEGTSAQATVVRVWRSGGESDSPRVRYTFTVDGREFTTSHRVPRKIWNTLKEGDAIEIRYAPADPSINHPVAWTGRVTPLFLALLMPLMFLGFAWGFVWLIRRQWNLLAEGRPAPAIVTSVKRTDKAVLVRYEFPLLNGAIQKGKTNTSRKAIPGIGDVVCVLYDPDNPRRNALYPLQFVRMERL
jgi:hypothetical protein